MSYIFEEKNYKTLAACYKANKHRATVNYGTVRNRLKNGWPLDQALLKQKEKTIITRLGNHTVEGKVFKNLPSIAEEYGMSLNTIYKRYSRGSRGDDLIPLNKRKSYFVPEAEIKYSFHANGIGYKSAADACRKLNIKYVTYRSRLQKGLTVEQALNIAPVEDGRVLRGEKFNVDGILKSILELSNQFQISEMTIRDRLKRGATIRQAIGLDKTQRGVLSKRKSTNKQKNIIRLEVDGEIFNSYKSLADKYGIRDYIVRQRIVDYGYTPEDAVHKDGKGTRIKVNGVEYQSKTALAEAYGLTVEVLLARLAGGATIEQALRLEFKETSKTVTYEGEKFKSLKDLAEKNGISAIALRARISSGLSLNEAINAGERIINSGRYNLTILERDSKLANKACSLYFVKINIEGNVRFKIGITTQSINDRLKQESYNFEIIKTISDTLINCFKLEQQLISLLLDKRDTNITSDMLDGYSEIFDLDEIDVLEVLDLLRE